VSAHAPREKAIPKGVPPERRPLVAVMADNLSASFLC
jgi:hypothetical protein